LLLPAAAAAACCLFLACCYGKVRCLANRSCICMSMLWFDVEIWSELMTMKSMAVACTDHACGVVDRDDSCGQQLESVFYSQLTSEATEKFFEH